MNLPYIITDTHFGHELMFSPEIGRPKDFNEKLFKAMSQLKDGDILIHLGDICIGNDREAHEKYIKPLKCKKFLVRGNHDKKSNNWYLDNGWDFVCDSFTWTYHGKKILFTHIPMPWDGVSDLNIHGHLHNCGHRNSAPLSFNKLLACEINGYKPVSLNSFISK